jgi:hypothetical protein
MKLFAMRSTSPLTAKSARPEERPVKSLLRLFVGLHIQKAYANLTRMVPPECLNTIYDDKTAGGADNTCNANTNVSTAFRLPHSQRKLNRR